MVFEKEIMPQFREADADGLVGLRGYLNYFQDVATHYMHNLGKGNDTLPEEYGICWMYTKYKMQIRKRADFTSTLRLETWMEKGKSSAIANQGLILSRNGEIFARGRLESCLYDMNRKRLTRLSAVDFPTAEAMEDRRVELGAFIRPAKQTEDMTYSYTHTVRYTDLDKSGHMTNLQYIQLLLNAFSSAYFRKNEITDFEIHYLSQCFEGEEIRVYQKAAEEGIRLTGAHADGTAAVEGFLKVSPRS